MGYRFRRRLLNFLISILVIYTIVLAFFAIVCVAFNYTHIKSPVQNFSMYPTLNYGMLNPKENGDTVYINRYAEVKRGDIVVANVPWWQEVIIKRLVALPGDSLRVKDAGEVYELIVNEQVFRTYDKYITSPIGGKLVSKETDGHFNGINNIIEQNKGTSRVKQNANGEDMLIMQPDEYFLLGDNWANSTDCSSENCRPAKKSEIIGSVDVIIKKNENKYNAMIVALVKMIFTF